MAEVTGAERRWSDALAAWAVPIDILAQAPERPYMWPTSRFKRTDDRPLATLPTGGSVLDVGVGWASLWLAPPGTRIIGVDPDPGMLAAFSAAVNEKGVVHSEVDGSWPKVASRVECADVGVSNHVVYDVPGVAPFLLALTEYARCQVVVELTTDEPAAWLNRLCNILTASSNRCARRRTTCPPSRETSASAPR